MSKIFLKLGGKNTLNHLVTPTCCYHYKPSVRCISNTRGVTRYSQFINKLINYFHFNFERLVTSLIIIILIYNIVKMTVDSVRVGIYYRYIQKLISLGYKLKR